MHVAVDKSRCVASGQCVLTAPGVFDQDDNGTVALLDPAPPACRASEVGQAVSLCPARAITVTADAADTRVTGAAGARDGKPQD